MSMRLTSHGVPFRSFQHAGSLDLLNGISEKELTIIVKDLLFIEGVKRELKSILKRNPSVEEWARAISMDTA